MSAAVEPILALTEPVNSLGGYTARGGGTASGRFRYGRA